MKGSQRTVLFLIADTGAGHRSAANALRNAIDIIAEEERKKELESFPDKLNPTTYRIEIVDVFEEYSHFPLREAMKLYGPTIRYNPSLYGRFFHISNRAQSVEAAKTFAGPLIIRGLMRLITDVQPDVIVSIHPMLNHVAIEAILELGMKITFLTVVTDLISVHYTWYAPGADGYIVPTEQARRLYLKRGLDEERIHVLGMPIDPKFTLPMPEKEELKRRMGLQSDLPVVLLVGGGDGTGGLRSAIYAISEARLPVQLLIVTGRNKRLLLHLQSIHTNLKVPAKIFGFVNNMPEMMHTADVIVTKAGPGTICEALACNLPIILSGYVPGQEEGNVAFVTENDVGVLARTPTSLVEMLDRMIKPGSEILHRQLENARCIGRPRASFDIGNYILSFLPSSEEASLWQNAGAPRPARVHSRHRVVRKSQSPARKPLMRRAASASFRHLRRNIAQGTFLRRRTRATGPLDLRAPSRRLPRLVVRSPGLRKPRDV